MDTTEPTPKRKRNQTAQRANPGEVDLVYPFWYQVESPVEITPPFLDPSGPLYTSLDGNLSLRLSAPITNIQRSIGLKTDSSLSVNSNGALQVAVDPTGPVISGNGGLTVTVASPLEVVANSLQVKTDPSSAITTSADGLTLSIDPQQFTVSNGQLQLLKAPTTTAATLTGGSAALNSPTAQTVNASHHPNNVSFYLRQCNLMGMLVTSLYLKMDSNTMGERPSGAANENSRYFTFWVSAFPGVCDPSNLGNLTVEPSNVLAASFEPAPNPTQPPSFDLTTTTTPYYQANSGVLQTYAPLVTGTFAPGTINVRILPTDVIDSSGTYTMIAFTYQCSAASIFNPSKTGTLTIGPVVYACPARSAPIVTS